MRLYFIGGHHIFLELCFYKKEPQAPNGGQIQKMLKAKVILTRDQPTDIQRGSLGS